MWNWLVAHQERHQMHFKMEKTANDKLGLADETQ